VEANTGFKGFMVQGRAVADDSPVGTWQVPVDDAKTVCDGEVRNQKSVLL